MSVFFYSESVLSLIKYRYQKYKQPVQVDQCFFSDQNLMVYMIPINNFNKTEKKQIFCGIINRYWFGYDLTSQSTILQP